MDKQRARIILKPRNDESIKKELEFLASVAGTEIDSAELHTGIRRVLTFINKHDESLEGATLIELVRSLQLLVQTQRLIDERPTSIVQIDDLSKASDSELELLKNQLLAAEKGSEDKPTIH